MCKYYVTLSLLSSLSLSLFLPLFSFSLPSSLTPPSPLNLSPLSSSVSLDLTFSFSISHSAFSLSLSLSEWGTSTAEWNHSPGLRRGGTHQQPTPSPAVNHGDRSPRQPHPGLHVEWPHMQSRVVVDDDKEAVQRRLSLSSPPRPVKATVARRPTRRRERRWLHTRTLPPSPLLQHYRRWQ